MGDNNFQMDKILRRSNLSFMYMYTKFSMNLCAVMIICDFGKLRGPRVCIADRFSLFNFMMAYLIY